MAIKIFHNPRCSKSRQALQLLEERGQKPEICLYLEKPLNELELKAVLQKLDISPQQLLRKKEAEYLALKEKFGEPTGDMAIQWMIENPKLMERPIVLNGDQARIGRPPEKVLEIL